MKTWMKWALAGVVVALAAGLFIATRNKTMLKMALADFKKAGSVHQHAKAISEASKRTAAASKEKAEKHLVNANRAADRANRLQDEARQIANEVSHEMPDSERARRFNARHGLANPRG